MKKVLRTFWWKVLRTFFFRLDPELAHRLTFRLIRFAGIFGKTSVRIVSGSPQRFYPDPERPKVLGMDFRSRVGLAAGFDKDAELVAMLPSLGFGFAEIGTVTPRPQPGNDRPRLFRDPSRQSLFNRMGFNGAGAEVVARHLSRAKPSLPPDFRVGVNLGKNKDTSLENAASDYGKAAALFRDLADYLVINVSSPNTPGLRSLQTAEALRPIVDAVNVVTSSWSRRPPLLLKIAPELEDEELTALIHEAESWKIDGWVLTNTLGGKRGELAGGWSGGCLTEKARASLIQARKASRLPIISVGGIMTEEEAIVRRREGADLVQIYSGWIYRGPAFPAQIGRFLAEFELQKTKKP